MNTKGSAARQVDTKHQSARAEFYWSVSNHFFDECAMLLFDVRATLLQVCACTSGNAQRDIYIGAISLLMVVIITIAIIIVIVIVITIIIVVVLPSL